MNRRLRFALAFNLVAQTALVAAGRYRLSFDACTHMFFANHYAHGWWNLWEARWYTGFDVTSYPPLAHQFVSLISLLVGVETGFALALLALLGALPLGVYAFARIFVSPRAAGWASLVGAALPSVYLTAHTFGQLPTLAGLLAALFAVAVLARFLPSGGWRMGALAASLTAVAAAAHHGTLLFLGFAIPAIGLHILLARSTKPNRLVWRSLSFGVVCLAAIGLVIWPFWLWGVGEAMQTPIDHLSRHSFIADPYALTLFFWPMFGSLMFATLAAFWQALHPRRIALWLLFGSFFLLGLGGTTALPRWLFGAGWEWLTYDRFALWASVTLLPLIGRLHALPRYLLRLARKVHISPPLFSSLRIILRVGAPGFFLGQFAICIWAAWLPTLLPTQPAPIAMQPIVEFLANDGRGQWRYLTFGFGDQMACLSLLTPATTLDGSYHTARTLPELRASGVGQIDSAFWLADGLEKLDPILAKAGERGVRWGFVALSDYEPLLASHGWRPVATLANGIAVWENPAATLPEDTPPPQSLPAALSWGILPLLALGLALLFVIQLLPPILTPES